jgi:hypothetical protein
VGAGDTVSRSGARWIGAAWLPALLALGCQNPHLTLAVGPAACAPAEPVRVEVRMAPERQGPVPVELRDAAGQLLAEATLQPAGGRGSLWLYPRAPSVPGPLRLRARGPAPGLGSRWRSVELAVDRDRLVARAQLLGGFHGEEGSPDGRFRWTSDCALAELERVDDDAVLHLRHGCGGGPDRTVELHLGGERAATWRCGQGEAEPPRTLRLLVPRRAWGGSCFLPVEIRVEPPFRPAEGGLADTRDLGIQVFFLVATPASGLAVDGAATP